MKLTVLGCGDAFGSEGRFNTSFLVQHDTDESKLLVDCGATTLVRIKQLKVDVESISTIIITHFHGDHYGGLPFLVLSKYFECKQLTPLTIVGPPGIREKTYNLQDALYPGTSELIDKLGIRFLEYNGHSILNVGNISIQARKVTHSPPSNPHGIKVEWHGKVFGFTGDTEWDDSLIYLADGTDLFITECNNFDKESSGHLSYMTLIKRLGDLNSKRVLLSHMGSPVIQQKIMAIERLSDGLELLF